MSSRKLISQTHPFKAFQVSTTDGPMHTPSQVQAGRVLSALEIRIFSCLNREGLLQLPNPSNICGSLNWVISVYRKGESNDSNICLCEKEWFHYLSFSCKIRELGVCVCLRERECVSVRERQSRYSMYVSVLTCECETLWFQCPRCSWEERHGHFVTAQEFTARCLNLQCKGMWTLFRANQLTAPNCTRGRAIGGKRSVKLNKRGREWEREIERYIGGRWKER